MSRAALSSDGAARFALPGLLSRRQGRFRRPDFITALRVRCDITVQNDIELRMLAALMNEPIDSAEKAEPMLSTEPTEPMLRIEPTDPMLAMEPTERREAYDCVESSIRERLGMVHGTPGVAIGGSVPRHAA
jgi:hypothetical protein